MQPASKQYKEAMKENIRDISYVYVYLGAINSKAQEYAYTDSEYTDYSNRYAIFGKEKFEAYYVTAEQNMAKVDGTQFFKPADSSAYALYQGVVSAELLGLAEFRFNKYTNYNFKGLTIDFSEFYPVDFDIVTDSKTLEVRGNSSQVYVTEEVFSNVNFIRIQPIAMVGGQQRLRILSILFGVGLLFDNNNLQSTSRKTTFSPINASIPSLEFKFVVGNTDLKYNKDNPNSFINFLEPGQACEFRYGRQMPDGSIYIVKGGNTFFTTATSDDDKATFTTKNKLSFLSDTFYKGKYYANGISLYDLAVIVFTDGKITNYYIDPYLKTVYTKNPLPVTTHKACLQLIAIAGRCVLSEDRNSTISLVSSFKPDVTAITANDNAPYSIVANLLNDTVVNEYVDATSNYARADGTQFFLPANASYLACGYVSQSISNESGAFTTNPTITINFESQFKMFGLTIEFGGSEPEEVIIHQYNDNTLVGDITIDEFTETTYISDEFQMLDKMIIEFTKAKPHDRIRVNKIVFGDVTDYTLTYDDMTKTPAATNLDYISYVDTYSYSYLKGTASKQLANVEAVSGTNTYKFSKPCHDYTVSFYAGTTEEPIIIGSDWTISIVDSGAYFIEVQTNVDAVIVINGYEFTVSESINRKTIHEYGTSKNCQNPLVSSIQLANDLSEWVSEYYANDVEYAITFKGEPRIDDNDLIYTENKFVNQNLVRVCGGQLDTTKGMSTTCKLNARRISYVDKS